MNILLINPPFYRFMGLEQDYVPLSLLAVGSQLIKEGHTVHLKNFEVGPSMHYQGYLNRVNAFSKYSAAVDSNSEDAVWQEVKDTIEAVRPDKIGINVLSVKCKSALKIIKIADSYKIPCFVGGAHVNIEPEGFPDHVERCFYEFESRNTSGRIKDLDELPMSNFDMLMDSYSPNGYAHIVSSRGCPFKCRFCASNTIWQNKVTFKSANRILNEMRVIRNRFNSTEFTFWDETFTLKKRRLLDFCNGYDIDATWNCDTRADVLSDEVIQAMKSAGCKHMSIGIESGRPHILEYIRKGEKIKDFLKAAELLNKNKIQWKAYCIIGFPEEDEGDMFYSIDFIKSLKPFRITLSFFTPYKQTDLYDECMQKGIIDASFDPTKYSHQSPNNYFCPKVSRERYQEIKQIISEDIDNYNKQAILTWK